MIGQTISHYRILEELGRGGMGVVYRAHDTKLERPAALKVLKPELLEDEEHRQRFLREALSAAAVTHPFIASIYDAGEADGTLFIAMEFVEGKTLRALLSKGPLPIPEAQQYATEIAEGLAKAHQAGLVHRDMKPDNVMIAADGHAKILDFGLAKIVEKRDEAATVTLGKAEPAEVTTQDAILGTPAYMSPEQARGEPVDSRSDIFSFGSTVYEMVTGKAPFRRTTQTDTLASILRDEPMSSHDSNPTVPGELSRIVSRCLHKEPEDRYNDTRDLVAALKDLQTASGEQSSRRWRRILAGIAALAAIVALVVVQPWKLTQSPDEQNVTSNAETPVRPNWILVAEFEGPPDDPDLAVVARELTVASLNQSEVVVPISRSDLKRGLELAMKPDTTRVVGEVARELAVRASASTYMEGRIDRVATAYSIVMHLKDSETGDLLASVRGTADGSDALISTLDALSEDLSRKLGENEEALRSRTSMTRAMTPSLEAYRLHVRAGELLSRGANDAAIEAARRALELDPDFAAAWYAKGNAYWNDGEIDSARVAYQEALARPERLTEAQRTFYEAQYAWALEGDTNKALRLIELLPRRSAGAENFRGNLIALARPEEALDSYRRSNQLRPFGPSQPVLGNEFKILLFLGRNDEAAAVTEKMESPYLQIAQLMLPLLLSRWGEAESLAVAFLHDPSMTPRVRFQSEHVLASVDASRGAVSRAAARLSAGPPGVFWANLTGLARIHLWDVSRGAIELPIPSATDDWVIKGAYAAIQGDTAQAQHCLRAIPTVNADQGAYLRARIHAAADDWESVVKVLSGCELRRKTLGGSRLPIEWLLAEAYAQIAQRAMAAEHLEKVLDPRTVALGFTGSEACLRGLYTSFAHHRLVLLYSKMGRVEDARRHWEIFKKTFTNPDPELVPMIEEARQALAAAEAKI